MSVDIQSEGVKWISPWISQRNSGQNLATSNLVRMRTQADRLRHDIDEGREGGNEVEAKWELRREDKDRSERERVQQDSVNCTIDGPRLS